MKISTSKSIFVGFLFVFFNQLNAQVNLNQGLSAYYPFNANVKDSIGSNHGTAMGSPTLTTNRWGQPNTCYRFNGNGDYIRVPDNSTLEPPAALSISAWVLCEDLSSWNVVVCKRAYHVSNPYNSYILYAAGTANQPQNWSFIVSPTQNTSYDVTQSSTLQTAKWVHLVGTYDSTTANGNNLKLYVDGQLIQSRKISGTIFYTDSSLRIGMAIPGNALQYFKGKIDDVRIYNRAINQQEVTALYTEEFHIYKTVNYEICQGDSILLGGKYRKNAGTYIDTIKFSNFDTVKTFNLLINPSFKTPRTVTICQGNSFFAGGKLQTTSGIYYDSLKTKKNCDSIIITTLVVNPSYLIQRAIDICKGNNVLLGGIQRTQSGVYYDSLKTIKGCDSIIMSTLVVNPTFILSQSLSICQGDSAKIGTKFRSQQGIYIDTLKTSKGCDSVITTSLVVNPKYNIIVNATICQKASVLINGKNYSKTGTFIDTFKTKFGCDSLIQVNISQTPVNINVTQNSNILIATAAGASYRWLDCNNFYFPLPGQNLQSFIAQTKGNYAVAVSQNNCTDTSICYIVPSGVGRNEIFEATAKIYPNPATDIVTIDFGDVVDKAEVTIYTTSGKKIMIDEISNTNIAQLSVKDIAAGLYILEINFGITQTCQKLFIR